MRVAFLGVGEACDERLSNTTVWLRTGPDHPRRSILLDCGFTAPPLYWRQGVDPDDLDAVWISHFHGDHFFGLPALLLRMWEMKREKPLVVVGQEGIEGLAHQAMDLAYPSFRKKLMYPIVFAVAGAGGGREILGLDWRFAESTHGQRNLAVRIDDGKHRVFYSGDGQATAETLELAKGCNLIVHEAFRVDQPTPGHGTVRECIDLAREAGAHRLGLVHVQRDERRTRHEAILNVIDRVTDLHAMLPEPGDVVELSTMSRSIG